MQTALTLDVLYLAVDAQLRLKLLDAGFESTSDLSGIGAEELAAELNIAHQEALTITRAVADAASHQATIPDAATSLQILQKEKVARNILTFSGDLDSILGGGIHTSQVTEICGVPAIGKTQIGMQLSIDVQIPKVFNGLDGQAVFIDTEGSFFLERAKEMADAFVRHLQKLAAASSHPQRHAAVASLTREAVLEKIHYFRVLDLPEQTATIKALGIFINNHPKVKLVVVDSLAFHLRQDMSDMAARSRLLAETGQELVRLAEKHDLAVVLTNHMTTKVSTHQTRIIPALGDSWAHAATNRVVLLWKEGNRCALLQKSPSLPPRTAEFMVTDDGIRGRQAHRKRPRAEQPQASADHHPSRASSGVFEEEVAQLIRGQADVKQRL